MLRTRFYAVMVAGLFVSCLLSGCPSFEKAKREAEANKNARAAKGGVHPGDTRIGADGVQVGAGRIMLVRSKPSRVDKEKTFETSGTADDRSRGGRLTITAPPRWTAPHGSDPVEDDPGMVHYGPTFPLQDGWSSTSPEDSCQKSIVIMQSTIDDSCDDSYREPVCRCCDRAPSPPPPRAQPIRTEPARSVPQECDCPEAPADGGGVLLLGTLAYETPPGWVKGQDEYEIKVRYVRNELEGKAAKIKRLEKDYQIMLNIVGLDPSGVSVSSPTDDYVPLGKGGEWTMPVYIEEGVEGPVTVEIEPAIFNKATGKEQTLPVYSAVINDASSCPECPKCPETVVEKEPFIPPEPKGFGWSHLFIVFVLGMVVGGGGGFTVAKKSVKPAPTISK